MHCRDSRRGHAYAYLIYINSKHKNLPVIQAFEIDTYLYLFEFMKIKNQFQKEDESIALCIGSAWG